MDGSLKLRMNSSIANEFADAPGRQNRKAARATTPPVWLLAGCFLGFQAGAAANSFAIQDIKQKPVRQPLLINPEQGAEILHAWPWLTNQ